MSVQVFSSQCSAARRSLCSSQCLWSRCSRAYYSQPALSSVVGLTQLPSASAGTPLRHAVADTKNPLDPTRLDRYLESIRLADFEPTLDDVERCKPESFSPPGSSRYAAEYTDLLETLCRSFSKAQLRRFTELYKLDPIWTRSTRRKTEFAESIMEKAWGWPSLKEIERKWRDTTEVLVKSFTVTPAQLFLIMGKDGAELLQLSMQYNVHISLTTSPLALRVEGLRGSLKGLTEHISTLKQGIINEIYELPSGCPIRPDLLQPISRLSGAFVENHGNRGKVHICAKDPDNVAAAKRLALRASLEVGTQEWTVCYYPPKKMKDSPIEISEPQRYTVYPFATPYPFPWMMRPGGAFRLRRVADWLGVDSYEDITSTGGLTENPHRLLNLNQGEEELSRLVYSKLPKNILHSRKTISATLGHILILSGDSSRDTIFPPLRSILSLPDALKWVETSGTSLTFVPSDPFVTMKGLNDQRKALHRLVYRTLPQVDGQVSERLQHVLKFEMELSCRSSTSAQAIQYPENASKLGNMLPSGGLNSSTKPDSSRASVSQPGDLSEGWNKWNLSCQVGREVHINLMLPDRPMDMQLSVSDWDDITPMQQPQILMDYAAKLRDYLSRKARSIQPDPPSMFKYEGKTYYLHDSLNLRQCNNPSLPSTVSADRYKDDLVTVSCEGIVDLQSDQRIELCQVKIGGSTVGPSWKRFLVACDQLSAVSLGSRGQDKPQMMYLGK